MKCAYQMLHEPVPLKFLRPPSLVTGKFELSPHSVPYKVTVRLQRLFQIELQKLLLCSVPRASRNMCQ